MNRYAESASRTAIIAGHVLAIDRSTDTAAAISPHRAGRAAARIWIRILKHGNRYLRSMTGARSRERFDATMRARLECSNARVLRWRSIGLPLGRPRNRWPGGSFRALSCLSDCDTGSASGRRVACDQLLPRLQCTAGDRWRRGRPPGRAASDLASRARWHSRALVGRWRDASRWMGISQRPRAHPVGWIPLYGPVPAGVCDQAPPSAWPLVPHMSDGGPKVVAVGRACASDVPLSRPRQRAIARAGHGTSRSRGWFGVLGRLAAGGCS